MFLFPKPVNEWKYVRQGLQSERYGRDSKAAVSFARALEINPRNITALTHRADSLYRLAKYEESAVAYDAALAEDPKNIDALYGRGLVLEKLKEYGAALDSFEMLLGIDPGYVDAAAYAALCRCRLGSKDTALAQLAILTAEHPERIAPHYCQSLVMSAVGDAAGSIRSLDAARDAEHAHSDSLCDEGMSHQRQKRYQRAVEMYTKSLYYNPDNTRALVAKAWLFDYVGMPTGDVIPLFERAIMCDPRCTEAHLNLGFVHDRRGLYRKAVSCFDAVLEYEPGNIRAMYSKGVSLYSLKERAAAVFFCESAIRADPHNTMALCSMVWILEHEKRYDDALAYCEMAIKSDPEYAYAHSYRGKILYMQKKYKDALESYQMALDIDPGNKTALYYHSQIVELMEKNAKKEAANRSAEGRRRSIFGI